MATYGKREPTEPKRPRKPGTYRKNAKSSHVVRPKGQWTHVPIVPLVTAKEQAEVAARLSRNKIFSPRNTRHDYLLRTLVTCGECGWKMGCTHQKSVCKRYEYFYYGCERRDPVDTGRPTKCTARRVRADELDAVVWDALRGWIESPEMLQREIDAWQQSARARAVTTKESARLDASRRQLEAQIERLIDAYQRGAIDVAQLKARRERLEAELASNRLRAEELSAQRMDSARTERIAKDIAAFAAALRDGLDALDFAGRQKLVRLLVERVVVTGDNLTIEHAIPLSGRFGGLRLGNRALLPRLEGSAAPR
jgi:site-specific DNA recombinase